MLYNIFDLNIYLTRPINIWLKMSTKVILKNKKYIEFSQSTFMNIHSKFYDEIKRFI